MLVLLSLCLLQTKHLLIDWVWQPKYEWSNKGTYLHFGGIRHAGKNAIGTALCLLVLTKPLLAFLLGALDFLIHYHIDYLKMNLNRYLNLKPDTSDKFWWLLGFDQYLHQMTYLLLIYLGTLS